MISKEKVRISVTIPRDTLEVMRKEANVLGVTVSQYVVMTMKANSFLGDGRTSEIANYQLQRLRDIAWGYDVSERDEMFPHLVGVD